MKNRKKEERKNMEEKENGRKRIIMTKAKKNEGERKKD